MLKEWRRQKEAQVLRNYVKEVDGLTWQKSLLKPSERQIEGDQSFFKVQNEAVYRAISSDINNKARFALLKLRLLNLGQSRDVRKNLESIKKDLLERAQLSFEFYQQGVNFPRSSWQRLLALEEKYGGQENIAYLQKIAAEFEEVASKKSLWERDLTVEKGDGAIRLYSEKTR